VLQAAEFAFHGCATTVEIVEPLRVTLDARVEARSSFDDRHDDLSMREQGQWEKHAAFIAEGDRKSLAAYLETNQLTGISGSGGSLFDRFLRQKRTAATSATMPAPIDAPR
jgi:hypothetical protein